jgi:hypothetical protein
MKDSLHCWTLAGGVLLIVGCATTPAAACNCGAAQANAKSAASALAAKLSAPRAAPSRASTSAREVRRPKEAPSKKPGKDPVLEAYSGASDGETWVQ